MQILKENLEQTELQLVNLKICSSFDVYSFRYSGSNPRTSAKKRILTKPLKSDWLTGGVTYESSPGGSTRTARKWLEQFSS